MRLFQMPIPLKPNDGGKYATGAHNTFLDAVLTIAGGYTLLRGSLGAWRDPSDGTIYREEMDLLQFTLPDTTVSMATLKACFFRCFPDQKCLMVSDIGEALFFSAAQKAA